MAERWLFEEYSLAICRQYSDLVSTSVTYVASLRHHFCDTWWRHQMETLSAYLALCAGNSPVPVISPHKGQWRGALMFSLICVWINGWVNNREAGYLRRHRGHYDVNVMSYRKPSHQHKFCASVLEWLPQILTNLTNSPAAVLPSCPSRHKMKEKTMILNFPVFRCCLDLPSTHCRFSINIAQAENHGNAYIWGLLQYRFSVRSSSNPESNPVQFRHLRALYKMCKRVANSVID